jgi:mRNA interferase RelE/StbE
MYEIFIERTAEKEFDELHSPFFEKLTEAIIKLSDNPSPDGCKMLKGLVSDWRIRVGNFRIIYEINDKENIINIMKVRLRKDIYR